MNRVSTMTMVEGTTLTSMDKNECDNKKKAAQVACDVIEKNIQIRNKINQLKDTVKVENFTGMESSLNGNRDVIMNNDYDTMNNGSNELLGFKFQQPLKMLNIISISLFHLIALYVLVRYPTSPKLPSILWGFLVGGIAGFGVTGGVHRLWSHKSYKAKLPLRIILALCFSVAGQNTIYDWVRDHRIHHKFSETDADPHNSNRGFFFAHVGWLMMRKHPEVITKGNQIDMSDILADPVVQFHQRWFLPLKLLLCFILPTVIPTYFWGEKWYLAVFSQVFVRYVFSLNFTWLVNSAAHIWGYRPFDKKINPAENISVAIVAMGEGWHNYHHVFPWDYKAAELGDYTFNITTFWIDMFAKIGWAYDLKQPSKELVRKTVEKYGDGSHPEYGHNHHHHNHITEVPPPEEDENANISKNS